MASDDRQPIVEDVDQELYARPSQKSYKTVDSASPSLFSLIGPGSSLLSKVLFCSILTAGAIGLLVFILLIVAALRLNNQQSLPEICANADCVWEASELRNSMTRNESVQPCDNFYEYACGNFASLWPDSDYWGQTITNIIRDENQKKLEAIMKKRPKGLHGQPPKSYEDKLKVFYESCTNEFQRGTTGVKPILDAVTRFFGWNALGYNDPAATRRNLNYILPYFHRDYRVSPFFDVSVTQDYDYDSHGFKEKHIIRINSPDLGMSHYIYSDYTNQSNYYKYQYMTYIRTVISLLQKDSGYAIASPDMVATRVSWDVLNVETRLAKALSAPREFFDVDKTHKTISWLDETYGKIFSWYWMLSNIYSEAHLTQNAVVYITHPEYFAAIENIIGNITDRELNSYVFWKLVDRYINDLGWDYQHAARVWQQAYWGMTSFTSNEKQCFYNTQALLGYALAALFVEEHYAEGAHRQAKAIKDIMKEVAAKQIDGISWMDTATKDAAKNKLAKTVDNMGYPEWLRNRKQADDYYAPLTIESNKHFQNSLNLNKFITQQDALQLDKPYDPATDWNAWQIYSTYPQYSASSNQLTFPAGLLQHPIFSPRVPQYINFAAFGRYLGATLTEVFGYGSGRWYDENGKYVTNGWWSEASKNNYEKTYNISGCHTQLFQDRFGFTRTYYASWLGSDRESTLAGFRIAYEAYRLFEKRYGAEPMLPGFQWSTTDHGFFLSFAQTFCRSEYRNTGTAEERVDVHQGKSLLESILENTKQFGDTYKCKAGQRLATQPDFCRGYY